MRRIYPVLIGTGARKTIVGLYDNNVVRLAGDTVRPAVDVINGKTSEQVVLSLEENLGKHRYFIRNALGEVTKQGEIELGRGVTAFSVRSRGFSRWNGARSLHAPSGTALILNH